LHCLTQQTQQTQQTLSPLTLKRYQRPVQLSIVVSNHQSLRLICSPKKECPFSHFVFPILLDTKNPNLFEELYSIHPSGLIRQGIELLCLDIASIILLFRTRSSAPAIERVQSQPVGLSISTPTLQKSEGFRAMAPKGAAVVNLLQALGNTGSGVLRLSRRVKKMA